MDKTGPISFWWCDHCKEEVDGTRVTFQEHHDTCGYIVRCLTQPDAATAREARLVEALDGWVDYHKSRNPQQRCGCPGNGYGGACTDSGGWSDGLDNANPSQICDFHKLLRSTHKALAEAKRIQEGE